jgi:hypothetical protein
VTLTAPAPPAWAEPDRTACPEPGRGVASSRRTPVIRTGASRERAPSNQFRIDGLAEARAARAPSAAPAERHPPIVATTKTTRLPRRKAIAAASQQIARATSPIRDPDPDDAPATTPRTRGIATKRAGADMQSSCRAFQAGFRTAAQNGTRSPQKPRPRPAGQYAETEKGDRSLFSVRKRTNKSDLSPFPGAAAASTKITKPQRAAWRSVG